MALTRLGTNAITTVPNSAITLDAAEIPNLDTAKITTGTMASARISEASVTQHVTATDLQPIKSDISALALREATNEASAAFNLPNQFIETFTDDTNLGTQTTGDRTAGYWGTIVASTDAFTTDSDTKKLFHCDDNTDSSASSQTITLAGNLAFSTTQKKFGAKSIYCPGANGDYGYFANNSDFQPGTGALTVECWVYPTTDNGGSGTHAGVLGKWWHSGYGHGGGMNKWDFRPATADASDNFGLHDSTSMRNSGQAVPDNTWSHLAWTRDGSGDNNLWFNGVQKVNWTNSNNMDLGSTDYIIAATDNPNAYIYEGYVDEIRFSTVERYTSTFTPNYSLIANATGTLIQSANAVGSAKTKVGGTFLYKDNAGTATIGTDLKIYFTCDGGSNWTEAASYNAITPVYSTGVKQVRLGETTCTSGTDVRYKAVWANQAASSKETQLHGIGVNY